MHQHDIDLIRTVRGRFRYPAGYRLAGRAAGIFLVLAVPISCVLAWFSSKLSPFEVSILIAAGFVSPVFGSAIWIYSDREWRFTGNEIVARRRNLVLWQIPISAITDFQVRPYSTKYSWLLLIVAGKRHSVFVGPEFRASLKKAEASYRKGSVPGSVKNGAKIRPL